MKLLCPDCQRSFAQPKRGRSDRCVLCRPAHDRIVRQERRAAGCRLAERRRITVLVLRAAAECPSAYGAALLATTARQIEAGVGG